MITVQYSITESGNLFNRSHTLVIDAKEWGTLADGTEGSDKASYAFTGSLEDISSIVSRVTNDIADDESLLSIKQDLEAMDVEPVPIPTCFFCS